MLIPGLYHLHDQARAVRGHAGIVGAFKNLDQIPDLQRFISGLRSHRGLFGAAKTKVVPRFLGNTP